MKKDKKQIIETTLKMIENEFGKEAIMLLGKQKNLNVEVFPSGSLVIDNLVGINGYPKGRIIELYGPESSGKTTISLHAIAEVQKLGGIAAFIDAEHAIDPLYAKQLGVDINNLIMSQPDSGEQALDIVATLVKTGAIDLIIVDSVAALTPEAELNGEMRDQVVGGQARLMARALRKININLVRAKTTIIFINQIREKIGVMFGNPETTPGGRALKFFATLRIEVRRISSIGQGKDIRGNNIRVKIVKNKLAPPFQIGETEILFSQGISREGELIDFAEKLKIVTRAGSWYKYKNQNMAQGKEKFKFLLRQKKDLYKELYKKVMTARKQA